MFRFYRMKNDRLIHIITIIICILNLSDFEDAGSFNPIRLTEAFKYTLTYNRFNTTKKVKELK